MKAYGSCACEKVSYQLTSEFISCSYCHCSVCRKLTGSAFGSYGEVRNSSFEWIQGENLVNIYSQSENTDRCFCSSCGSFLVTIYKPEPDVVYVSLGSLHDASNIQMNYHQFFGSRVKWCEIQDELQKYGGWPDES